MLLIIGHFYLGLTMHIFSLQQTQNIPMLRSIKAPYSYFMNLYCLWIDFSHAIIFKSDETGERMSIREFRSDVEPHHHSGQSDSEHLTMTDQGSNMRRRKKEMNEFSEEVINRLRDADEIAIIGPGQAKQEFKNIIEKEHSLASKITAFETSHPLSEAELKAKARELLKLPRE